jgi:hypothetical protein
MSPTTDASRLFVTFQIIIGILFVVKSLNDFACACVKYALDWSILRILGADPLDRSTKYKILLTSVFFVLCLAVGVVFQMVNDEHTFITALYWCVVTSTPPEESDRRGMEA